MSSIQARLELLERRLVRRSAPPHVFTDDERAVMLYSLITNPPIDPARRDRVMELLDRARSRRATYGSVEAWQASLAG